VNHLDDDHLSALLDGALEGEARGAAQRHLLECLACRERMASVAALDKRLGQSLVHDPGEAYFERFADRVAGRIARGDLALETSDDAVEAAPEPAPVVKPAKHANGKPKRERKPEPEPATEAEVLIPPDVEPMNVSLRPSKPESKPAKPPKQPKPNPLAGVLAVFRTPRGLAWAGGVAAVVVGVGVVVTMMQNGNLPSLLKPELQKRADQVADQVRVQGGAASGEAADGKDVESNVAAKEPPAEADDAGVAAKLKEEAAAVAPTTAAVADRAVPARRDAHGEEVPARQETRFAAPPSGDADRTTSDSRSVTKPAARPLETKTTTPSATSADQVKKALDQAARSTASPSAGQSLAPATPVATLEKSAPKPQAPATEGTTENELTFRGGRSSAVVGNVENLPALGSEACGFVRDASGRPVAGAQVAFADLGRTSATDENGRWCLPASPGRHELSVLAVGFYPQNRTIDVKADSVEVNFTLSAVPVVGDLARRARSGTAADLKWPAEAQPIVERATARYDRAVKERSASQFDAAANDWEKVLLVAGSDANSLEARYRAAEARYLAWGIDPTAKREDLARGAIIAFLTRAPQGAARDSAALWMDRVGR